MKKDLLELRIQSMGSSPLFYEEPVHLVKGEGIWLYDDSNNNTWIVTTTFLALAIAILM